jgi:hypothetical protein
MVLAYLSNGHRKIAAVKAAYPGAKETSARVMSCTHFRRDDVVECLDAASGFSERQIFEEQLRRAMRDARTTPSQIAALRMFAQVKGWVVAGAQTGKKNAPTDDVAPATHRFKIGDTCNVNGKLYRVTGVNADGQPTSGDPL